MTFDMCTVVNCLRCGGLVERTVFNRHPVWVHIPHRPGSHWPNTHCRIPIKKGRRHVCSRRGCDLHALPDISGLLTDADIALLKALKVARDQREPRG